MDFCVKNFRRFLGLFIFAKKIDKLLTIILSFVILSLEHFGMEENALKEQNKTCSVAEKAFCLKGFLRDICAIFKRYALPSICVLLAIAIMGMLMLLCISAAVCDKTVEGVYSPELLLKEGEDFDCIMVLGCRVYEDGTPSPMLFDRVSVGTSLYLSGVANQILMSGDSHTAYYDEVGCMRDTAIELGVPAEAITTDAYGLSTYDSVARALERCKGKRVVIVTQEYHLYRALYIAQKLGLDAVGVSADLRPYANQYTHDLREVLARCKDVYYSLKRPPAASEMTE